MAPRLAIAAVAAVVVVSVLAILHSTATGPSPGPLRKASAGRHLAEAATASASDTIGDELAEDLARYSAQVEGTVGAQLEAENRGGKHKRKHSKRARKHMSKREKRATRHKRGRRRWWLDSPGFRAVQEACAPEAHMFCPSADRFFEFKAPQPAASLARSWSRDNSKPESGRDERHSPATVALASPMEAVQCLQMFTAELGDACRTVLAQLPTAQDDTLRALRLCYDDPPATCVPGAPSGSGDGAPATTPDGNDASTASGSEAGDASDAHASGSGAGSSDGNAVEEPALVAAGDGAAASERRALRSKAHAPVMAPDADVVAHTAPADLRATPEVEAGRDFVAPHANGHGDRTQEAQPPATRSDKSGRQGKKRHHKKRGKQSKKDSRDGDDALGVEEARSEGDVTAFDAVVASGDTKHKDIDAASDGMSNHAAERDQRQHKSKSGKRPKKAKKRHKGKKSKQKKQKKYETPKKHRGDEGSAGKTKKKRRSKSRKPPSLYHFLKCLRYNPDDLQGRCGDAWMALPASYYEDWKDSHHGIRRALVPSEDNGSDADGETPTGSQRRLSTRRQRLHHRRSLPTHYTVTLLAGGVVGILLAGTVAVVLIRRRNAARSRQAAAS